MIISRDHGEIISQSRPNLDLARLSQIPISSSLITNIRSGQADTQTDGISLFKCRFARERVPLDVNSSGFDEGDRVILYFKIDLVSRKEKYFRPGT